MSKSQLVPIDQIEVIQSRAALHTDTVNEYVESINDLPAAEAIREGEKFYVWDGAHRAAAHRQAGKKSMLCNVRVGTKRDAILLSLGANVSHGLRRTNEDKRRAVSIAIADEEWKSWSDERIASACAVGRHLVREIRASLTCTPSTSDKPTPVLRKYINKHGRVGVMNVAGINANRKKKPKNPPASEPESAPRAALTDEEGIEIPDDKILRAAFATRDDYDAALNKLTAIATFINSIHGATGGEWLEFQRAERQLKDLRAAIRFARPHAICPYCQGKGCASNSGCKGAKFLTEMQISRVPKEKRDAMRDKAVAA
jgi:uncharacterized ParB-like nuclease family protein